MPSLAFASFRRRIASLLYESLLLLGVLSITFLVPHLLLGLIWGVGAPGAIAWLHVFLVLGVYFIWSWLHGGQTLAMQTWRIRIENARSTAPLSRKQAMLRYALSWISVTFFGCGLLWALFDRERQFLHDRLAGTRLVFVPRDSNLRRG
jgi:uncharacterized RDD family membrane protein YckC